MWCMPNISLRQHISLKSFQQIRCFDECLSCKVMKTRHLDSSEIANFLKQRIYSLVLCSLIIPLNYGIMSLTNFNIHELSFRELRHIIIPQVAHVCLEGLICRTSNYHFFITLKIIERFVIIQ